jgi:hypothetical protein
MAKQYRQYRTFGGRKYDLYRGFSYKGDAKRVAWEERTYSRCLARVTKEKITFGRGVNKTTHISYVVWLRR